MTSYPGPCFGTKGLDSSATRLQSCSGSNAQPYKAILTEVDAVYSEVVKESTAPISAYHAADMHVGVLGNASAH